MEEAPASGLQPYTLNTMLIDMQEGVQPDVDFSRVVHTFNTFGDGAVKAVLSRYMRKEAELKTHNRESIARLIYEYVESEDELSLKGVLECLFHLPFAVLVRILKDLNSEVSNSLVSKSRSKLLVRDVISGRKASGSTSS